MNEFFRGFTSLFDFYGVMADRPYEPDILPDTRAIESDWRAVGQDIETALNVVGAEVMSNE